MNELSKRLTYIDLSNLYFQSEKSLNIEPGELAKQIVRAYDMKVILAFTIVTDTPRCQDPYIIHVNEDKNLIEKFDKIMKETDYLTAVDKILEEDKSLIAVVLFDGYDVGVTFSRISSS